MEAGRGLLEGRLKPAAKTTVVINDPEQVTPNGGVIVEAPGHGHELLYEEGNHVDSDDGLPKSV